MLVMRENKFRGKTKESKWVYGGYYTEKGKHYIRQYLLSYEVIPETVGQYTGLKDKNGVEIYEGDKVKQNGFWICIVKYLEPKFCLKVINNDKGIRYHNFFHGRELCGNIDKNVEVIGNIHDK